MKLTTRGRYAVTAMLDLALRAGNGPISLAEISERQLISLSYLEQLFAKLRRNGLVKSTRGPGGGYSIARGLDEVSVSDIISAVNESVDATSCVVKGNCHGQEGHFLTHDLWEGLSQQIEEFLGGISLQQLIEQKVKVDQQEVAAQEPKSAEMREESHQVVFQQVQQASYG